MRPRLSWWLRSPGAAAESVRLDLHRSQAGGRSEALSHWLQAPGCPEASRQGLGSQGGVRQQQ